jgi:hypothetical protein
MFKQMELRMATRKTILPFQTSAVNHETTKFRPRKWWIIFVIGVLNICVIGLILLYAPCFFSPSILPPYQTSAESAWENTTYSVQVWPPDSPLLQSKYYILRNEAMVFSSEVHGAISRKDIFEYFDKRLNQLDWQRYESSDYCSLYLPEAKFLNRDDNGYVAYRKKNYKESYDFTEGTTVCLAVWISTTHEDGMPYTFEVVMLTSRPSPLTLIGAVLGLQ